jgi:large-conductance mechanosensitive channel
VKFISKINSKKKEKKVITPSEPSKPTREEELLTEIRDTLKKISNK